MTCPFFVYGLEKQLKKIEGIEDLSISFDAGLVTFSLKEENKVSKEMIEIRVKNAGFTSREIKIPEKYELKV